MSVYQSKAVQVRYQWRFPMIPWHRQVISLVYGLGVILISLWALEQGSGPMVVLGVVGMSFLTLMLIFGVEINEVQILDKVRIDFTTTEVADKSEAKGQDKND